MTQHAVMALAALGLAASLGSSAAVRLDQVTPQTDEEFARVAHEAIEKVCTECHGIEDVTGMRRTGRDWNDLVASMAVRGATATDEQFAMIKRYLTRYYGQVLVNSASAEELSAVLGLSTKDANAVVEYRKASGKFADVDALLKVPGIDRSKIEAQPEALRFE